MIRDAFISHSSHDREAARRLERELEAQGLSVWLDDSEIRLGQLLGPELQQSVLDSGALVLLWSRAAADSRWVNAEWLMALHQDRLILPCVLDGTALPQCLAASVWLDLRKLDAGAVARLRAAIADAPGRTTPLAPVIRAESGELTAAIAALADGQVEMTSRLGEGTLGAAAERQRELDEAMRAALERWPLDPMVVNLDGYHLKNAYMLAHWDAIQAGRAPPDELLERAEWRFYETLSIDPSDPSALNGLGSILTFQRELRAAEFFILAAIRAAEAQGITEYEAAQHDLALVRRFMPS